MIFDKDNEECIVSFGKVDKLEKIFSAQNGLMKNSKEIVLEFIDTIPSEWLIIRGVLHAPSTGITSEISCSTRLLFGSKEDQMIQGVDENKIPDIFGILFREQMPSSVLFGSGHDYCRVLPIQQARRIAKHFIWLNYRGVLNFRWREPRRGVRPSFEAEVRLPVDDKKLIFFKIARSSTEHTDSGGTIAPIIDFCKKMNLKENS